MIRLIQDGVPNTCFIVLRQRHERLIRATKNRPWDYGDTLKKPQWPKRDDPDYEHNSTLYQQDLDYPSLADRFGWSIRNVKPHEGVCYHRGTDGTIDCPDCGTPALEFMAAAAAYLRENIGKTVEE